MTTRKYNAIKRLCALSSFGLTFDAVYNAAVKHFGESLDGMTAAQIAAVIEFGYQQHTHGEMNAE